MSDEKLVSLFGNSASALPAPVDQDTIARIEEVLEAARGGQIRGIAMVVITQGRSYRSWYQGETHELYGAVARLQFRVMSEADQDDDIIPNGAA